jgi:hypothetical protein
MRRRPKPIKKTQYMISRYHCEVRCSYCTSGYHNLVQCPDAKRRLEKLNEKTLTDARKTSAGEVYG